MGSHRQQIGGCSSRRTTTKKPRKQLCKTHILNSFGFPTARRLQHVVQDLEADAFHLPSTGRGRFAMRPLNRLLGVLVLWLGDSFEYTRPARLRLVVRRLSSGPLTSTDRSPSIVLVGAGPGDPDLLTVAAARLISNPLNVVIADRLVSSEVIDAR